jgi:hypothetical protein
MSDTVQSNTVLHIDLLVGVECIEECAEELAKTVAEKLMKYVMLQILVVLASGR